MKIQSKAMIAAFCYGFLTISIMSAGAQSPMGEQGEAVKSEYIAKVSMSPDTLNLADNARAAVRFYKNNLGPKGAYDAYLIGDPPYFELPEQPSVIAHGLSTSLHSLILLRQMIAGDFGKETEERYKTLLFGHGFDSSCYAWEALVTWYKQTRESRLKEIIDKTIQSGRLSAFSTHPPLHLDPLVRYYEMSADERAVKDIEKMIHWWVDESEYFNADGSFNVSREGDELYELFKDHVHARMRPTIGVIRYGIITGKLELVEWGKRIVDDLLGFSGGIGFIPERTMNPNGCESCALRDVLLCTILLAKNGYPQYWDVVERMARNHVVEQQVRNTSWIKQPESEPEETERKSYHKVADRVMGGWAGWSDPNDWYGVRTRSNPGQFCQPTPYHCCHIGGSMIYAVWHNVVTVNEKGVYVNLSLNRDSKRILIKSHRPYEGKIEILIHDAPKLFVRIPDWVNKNNVKVTVDAESKDYEWEGNYVKLAGLNPKQNVTITYPLRMLHVKTRIGGAIDVEPPEYTLTWRGNTVVELTPKGNLCPLYQREYFKKEKASLKKTTFYFPNHEIHFP